MERDNEQQSELIELGAASTETKGPHGPFIDQKLGAYTPGLTDN